MSEPIGLTGRDLTCEQVRAVATGARQVTVTPAGMRRAGESHRVAQLATRSRPVYGRTTGVGANRDVAVDGPDEAAHGLRLLRSHAGGAGPLVGRVPARAMLVVRLNQLAAGGSGVRPELLTALADACNRGVAPPVRRYGAIGTADLTSLASAALCLRGELPWHGGTAPAYPLDAADALAFISSNAATVGQAALDCHDLRALLRAGTVITALSFLAVDGATEAYAEPVHESRPHPGQRAVAATLRRLLAGSRHRPARIQDPFGFRAVPQVHGPAVDAEADLRRVLTIEMNAAGENPLVSIAEGDVFHNGNFHTAYLTQALDAMRTALLSTAALSTARLATLVEPAYTGLRPFLAAGPDTSSGIMILEYVAHSALADIRHAAVSTSLGGAVLSRGAEEHASFAALAALRTGDALAAYRVVLGCELVAAVRALRLRGIGPLPAPLAAALDIAGELDPDLADRPLHGDIECAQRLLPALAELTEDRVLTPVS